MVKLPRQQKHQRYSKMEKLSLEVRGNKLLSAKMSNNLILKTSRSF